MIIDKSYVFQRVDCLTNTQSGVLDKELTANDKLYRIKMRFPEWIRNIIFHPFNPAYSMFLQNKNKKADRNFIAIQPLYPFAVDFAKYIITNNVSFDTNLFLKEDEEMLLQFIDNRFKSLIPGYTKLEVDEKIKESQLWEKKIGKVIKKTTDGYTLSIENKEYYLPENSFSANVFKHDYGLKYLPDSVIEYIKHKDFLDIGAYIGDSAMYFSRNYEPKQVYAYEPMEENIQNIEKTISRNHRENIQIIPKGISDVQTWIDIFYNSDDLSSSSINNKKSNKHQEKKKIELTTIDDECANKTVGLIKMDIEGAEYYAIKGGLNTIKRDKPVLLISLYHTGKDFFEIPPLLKKTVPEYKFRFLDLRKNCPFCEKILVAYI